MPYTLAAPYTHSIAGYSGSYCDTAGTFGCTAGSPFRGDYTVAELRRDLAFVAPPFHDEVLQTKSRLIHGDGGILVRSSCALQSGW